MPCQRARTDGLASSVYSLVGITVPIALATVAATWLVRNKTALRQPHRDDRFCLARCHAVRTALTPPRHSAFRVVALLLLADGTCVLGTNDEASPTIAGSICAERSALLQYRILYGAHASPPPNTRIVAIYIVSDHEEVAITPGCLCREYMYGHDAIDPTSTRVVLQSADTASTPTVLSLMELYPYPSVTVRTKSTAEAIQISTRLQTAYPASLHQLERNGTPVGRSDRSWTDVQTLIQAAQKATERTNTLALNAVYPIRYAAAAWTSTTTRKPNGALETKWSIVTGVQYPALEYGCTQDAVCQLLAKLNDSWSVDATPAMTLSGGLSPSTAPSEISSLKGTLPCRSQVHVIVQVDQWGIIHAPFAAARSVLVEHGHRDCTVIVATLESIGSNRPPMANIPTNDLVCIQAVAASALAPRLPAIF